MGLRVDFLVRRLREESDTLDTQFVALPAEAWATRVYPAADAPWTTHSILADLVSAEGYIRLMMADIAAGGPGAPTGLDIDGINASEVATLIRFSPATLLTKLRASRTETLAQVMAFTDADLDRRGHHPMLGEMPLEDFVKLIYRHDKMHMRDVQHAQKNLREMEKG